MAFPSIAPTFGNHPGDDDDEEHQQIFGLAGIILGSFCIFIFGGWISIVYKKRRSSSEKLKNMLKVGDNVVWNEEHGTVIWVDPDCDNVEIILMTNESDIRTVNKNELRRTATAEMASLKHKLHIDDNLPLSPRPGRGLDLVEKGFNFDQPVVESKTDEKSKTATSIKSRISPNLTVIVDMGPEDISFPQRRDSDHCNRCLPMLDSQQDLFSPRSRGSERDQALGREDYSGVDNIKIGLNVQQQQNHQRRPSSISPSGRMLRSILTENTEPEQFQDTPISSHVTLTQRDRPVGRVGSSHAMIQKFLGVGNYNQQQEENVVTVKSPHDPINKIQDEMLSISNFKEVVPEPSVIESMDRLLMDRLAQNIASRRQIRVELVQDSSSNKPTQTPSSSSISSSTSSNSSSSSSSLKIPSKKKSLSITPPSPSSSVTQSVTAAIIKNSPTAAIAHNFFKKLNSRSAELSAWLDGDSDEEDDGDEESKRMAGVFNAASTTTPKNKQKQTKDGYTEAPNLSASFKFLRLGTTI